MVRTVISLEAKEKLWLDRAAQLRQSFRWRLPDVLQAAAAIHHGLRLATRNTKDFPPRRHDFVVVPYEIRG